MEHKETPIQELLKDIISYRAQNESAVRIQVVLYAY